MKGILLTLGLFVSVELQAAFIDVLRLAIDGTQEESEKAGAVLERTAPGAGALADPEIQVLILRGLEHERPQVRRNLLGLISNVRTSEGKIRNRVLGLYKYDPDIEVRAAALSAASGVASVKVDPADFQRLRQALASDELPIVERAQWLLSKRLSHIARADMATLKENLGSKGAPQRKAAAEVLLAYIEKVKAHELLMEAIPEAQPEEFERLRDALLKADLGKRTALAVQAAAEKIQASGSSRDKQAAAEVLAHLGVGETTKKTAKAKKPPEAGGEACDGVKKLPRRSSFNSGRFGRGVE